MAGRVALVTGSNKGIGYAIVKGLAKKFNGSIYVLSRKPSDGEAAIAKLKTELNNSEHSDKLKYHQCDINDQKSVLALAAHVKQTHADGVDVMVHNAGIGHVSGEIGEVARGTLETNYFGSRRISDAFLPLMKQNGRWVYIASRAGLANNPWFRPYPQHYVDTIMSDTITISEIDDFVNNYVKSAQEGKLAEQGVPDSALEAYAFSKAALLCLTRAQARANKVPGLLINAACPGITKTDLAPDMDGKTPDEAAITPVYVATLPVGDYSPTGKFFAEKRDIPFDKLAKDDMYYTDLGIDLDAVKEKADAKKN